MPKRVVTLTKCSFCDFEDSDQNLFAEMRLTLRGSVYLYDVCETCLFGSYCETLLQAGVLQKRLKGRKTGPTPPVSVVSSPVVSSRLNCECGYKAKNGTGLAAHKRSVKHATALKNQSQEKVAASG